MIGRLADGTVVNHLVNWLSPMKERVTIVTGEKGCFVADTLTADLTFYANSSVATIPAWEAMQAFRGVSEGDMVRYAIAKPEPLRTELEAFRDAVLDVDGGPERDREHAPGAGRSPRGRSRAGVGRLRCDCGHKHLNRPARGRTGRQALVRAGTLTGAFGPGEYARSGQVSGRNRQPSRNLQTADRNLVPCPGGRVTEVRKRSGIDTRRRVGGDP